ncbi:MAG: class I SAM-dependent RNA methyltransferase [Chitinophagaceae bacterium]|nr:MAG: class I SAM-dependent RNA methyltransferase [Chitinophagaceae bacterium]
MNVFTTPAPVTITCHKRLAPYLEQEVRELGFNIEETFITGVRITATVNECMILNLSLRCASQVLYSLKKFRAVNADHIYNELKNYPWEELIPDPGYFSVTSNVMNDTINNNMFANLRVKDAIVDRLRDQRGVRPSTGAELTGTVVHLFWKNDEAEIFADTSGDSLARHGYRRIPGRAPMLEALAAATILSTKWDRRSPFVNPMCGSGTLAIEAALLASNTRPGLFRSNFAFMHLQDFREGPYLELRGDLENLIEEPEGLKIIASDYSNQAIENAKKNAKAAGVADMIDFAVCDFADTEVPQGAKGIMFVNPEYGERLGDNDELTHTYKRIGDFMKQRCGGYFGYMFTGNLELAKKIGLKPSRKIEFYTSTIDCRLFEYELYEGSRRSE